MDGGLFSMSTFGTLLGIQSHPQPHDKSWEGGWKKLQGRLVLHGLTCTYISQDTQHNHIIFHMFECDALSHVGSMMARIKCYLVGATQTGQGYTDITQVNQKLIWLYIIACSSFSQSIYQICFCIYNTISITQVINQYFTGLHS